MGKVKIPETVEQAIEILDEELDDLDKEFLVQNGPESVHFSLGRWIRNEWGLWKSSVLKGELLKEGFLHPDEMSNHIIEEYIKHLEKTRG